MRCLGYTVVNMVWETPDFCFPTPFSSVKIWEEAVSNGNLNLCLYMNSLERQIYKGRTLYMLLHILLSCAYIYSFFCWFREVEDFARRLNSDWPQRMQEIRSLGQERRRAQFSINGNDSLRRYACMFLFPCHLFSFSWFYLFLLFYPIYLFFLSILLPHE